jgi:peptide/nickel transport system substrate-binding protein
VFSAGQVTLNDLNTFNFSNPTSAQLQVMQNANQSIQILDPYTIEFHLPNPVTSFLARLASPSAGIVDPTSVQQHGGVQGNATQNTYITANGAPGTGPYVIASWVHGQSITLTLNPHYWGATPHVSKVVIQYKTNTLDAINDLKTGVAQMLYTVPFNLLPSITNTPGVTLENQGLTATISFVGINTLAAPLNNTDVRLAINYAINKTAIIQSILGGFGVPFQGPMPLGYFGYNSSIAPIGYNLSMAKSLLVQAGFPGGKGIRPLTLMYYTGDPVVQGAAEAIVSDLAQIGVTVNLVAVTYADYANVWATEPRVTNYPDFLWGIWFPDYAYADDTTPGLEASNSAFNMANFNNTQMDGLINQALTTSNLKTQAQLYSQIQTLDKQSGPYIWLYQFKGGNGVPAYSNSIHDVNYNPILYGFNYSAIYVNP